MYRKTYDGDGKNVSLEEGLGSRISIPHENHVDVHPQLVHHLVARTHWLYRPGSANVRGCGYRSCSIELRSKNIVKHLVDISYSRFRPQVQVASCRFAGAWTEGVVPSSSSKSRQART